MAVILSAVVELGHYCWRLIFASLWLTYLFGFIINMQG